MRLVLSIAYALVMLCVGVSSFVPLPKRGSPLFVTLSSTDTLSSIGGLVEVKRALRRTVLLPLRHAELFAHPLLRPPRGTLLCGPPGTGKTMLARALAVEAAVPFMPLHPATLESKWWGESPKILAGAFADATKHAPCIMFFDEIDGIGRARSESDQSCVYSFKCELLRHLDGVETSTAPVAVLACTNCPRALDPALRRRFGQHIEVPLPDEAARHDILRKVARHERAARGTLRRVAAATAGCSGSDLAALYAEATGARLDDLDLDAAVVVAKNEADLRRRLGMLRWEHWTRSGRIQCDKKQPA